MTQEQQHLYGLLQYYVELCEKHNLRYYLAGGTLLGAVRHHGFIPWDDDIDVMMPEEDYQKFLQLKSELPPHLRIQSEKTDPKFPFFFCQLSNTDIPFETGNRFGPQGVYIDIFPLVPSCAPTRKARFYFDIISVIGYVLQVKSGWTRYIPYKQKIARIGYQALWLLSEDKLRRLRKYIVKRLSVSDTPFCFSPGGGHKGTTEFYFKDWFSVPTSLEFEGQRFSVPAGWDAYLKQLYGDYMTPPDEAHRVSEHKEKR